MKEKTDGVSPVVAELYEWAEAAVFSIIFVVLLFTFVFRQVGVGGISMENTLNKGAVSEDQYIDRLLISNFRYVPRRGDIVVISTPAVNKPIIKRVIGLSGETVNIDFKRHIVYINGKPLVEPYISERTALQGDVEFPQKVPAGHVFVMGDNRNHSEDSRFQAIGMVDVRNIMGKAFFRIYPFSRMGLLE